MNPFDYKASRALSLFNSSSVSSSTMFGIFRFANSTDLPGKVLNDWQLSGIIQFQSGFPIRLQTQDDNELISSLFFLGAGAPQVDWVRCRF